MPNILDREQREALIARCRQLTPEHRPAWGTLTAGRMVCHLCDQLRVALGDVETRARGNALTHTLAKWMVLYLPLSPPKGKVKTVPEMLATEPTTWEADTAELESLVTRLAGAEVVAPHPVFGRLALGQWGILAAKHMDHHLRQFGV